MIRSIILCLFKSIVNCYSTPEHTRRRFNNNHFCFARRLSGSDLLHQFFPLIQFGNGWRGRIMKFHRSIVYGLNAIMLMICFVHILCRCGTTSTLYSNEKCVFVLLRFGSIKCAKRTCKCNHWIRVPLHPAERREKERRGREFASAVLACVLSVGNR